MEPLYLKVIASLSVIVILMLIRRLVGNIVRSRLKHANFDANRAQVTVKLLQIIYFVVFLISLAGIWGLEGSKVVTFIGTALTIVGVGFFAQWSLLSNITSGLILFFSHPLKIGDYIAIVDKDFPLQGQIEDITLFFIYVRDHEDRVFSISNTIMIQKTFRLLDSKDIDSFIEKKELALQEGESERTVVEKKDSSEVPG